MTRTPFANKFTSAQAIFDILEWIDEHGTVNVRQVMNLANCCERQARDYLAFLEGRALLRSCRRGRCVEFYRLASSGRGGAQALAKSAGVEFAVAVLGALRGTAFHQAAIDHVEALRSELGDAEGPRAARLRSAFYAIRGSVPANATHAEHAEELLNALMHGHQVRATYELLSTGKVKRYRLRPLFLVVSHHEGLHLLAQKRDGAIRTFDIEGFRSVERVRNSTSPPVLVAEEYFASAFGVYTDFTPEEILLKFSGLSARRIRRRIFHASQRVVDDDRECTLVRFHVGICPEFFAWILSMTPDVEVVAPVALRRRLQGILEAGAARHSDIPGNC